MLLIIVKQMAPLIKFSLQVFLFTKPQITTHIGIILVNLLLLKIFFSQLAGTHYQTSEASQTMFLIPFSVSSQDVMRAYCN